MLSLPLTESTAHNALLSLAPTTAAPPAQPLNVANYNPTYYNYNPNPNPPTPPKLVVKVYDSSGRQIVSEMREGLGVSVEVYVTGGSGSATSQLVLEADTNFNGKLEASEVTRTGGEQILTPTQRRYWRQLALPDDGPWPGNGTPLDKLTIKATYEGVTQTAFLNVINVPPRIVNQPVLSYGTDVSGSRVARVAVTFVDPGLYDRHTASVRWSDGKTTSGTLSQANNNYCIPGAGRSITVERRLAIGEVVYAEEVQVWDDDRSGGSSSPASQVANEVAVFKMLRKDVVLNDDDDNKSNKPDLAENPINEEDDVKPVDLSSLITSQMSIASGTFGFSYNSSVIRVWDSSAKRQLILSSTSTQLGTPPLSPGTPTIPYTGQSTVYVEGIAPGKSSITVSWTPKAPPVQPIVAPTWPACFPQSILGGSVDVTVWTIDLDIDSDNDNGFNYAENDSWEEYLEDSPYGIGKMIVPKASHFTPARLRLPKGLDPANSNILIELYNIPDGMSSGIVQLWTKAKADPTRNPNSKLSSPAILNLNEIGYDPSTGGITIFLEAVSVFLNHEYKVDIDANGKPGDRLVVKVKGLTDSLVLKDEVKWMAVNDSTIYPVLNESSRLRSAFASEAVYSRKDDPNHTLKLLSEAEVRDLIGNSLDGEAGGNALNTIINILFGNVPGIFPVPELKAAIYLDHAAAAAGSYILAFAGTEDTADWITNLENFLTMGEEQFWHATQATFFLSKVPAFRNVILTGHSLGGGLAAAGAIAAKLKAVTFNASGFPEHSLLDPRTGKPMFGEDSISRYYDSGELIDNFAVLVSQIHPDGSVDAKDILSWLQYTLLFVPNARGTLHEIEGLFNLDYYQRGVLNQFTAELAAIKTIKELRERWGKTATAGVWGIIFANSGAPEIMTESHKFPAIYYGLLHDDSIGWNIYDGLHHVP